MSAFINKWRGAINYSNVLPVLTLWRNGFLVSHLQELHTSRSCQVDRRKDKAIAQHLHYRNYEKTIKHRHHSIHELPDYSYTDGRPTEVAICQKKRQERNYLLAEDYLEEFAMTCSNQKQIVQLVCEVKFAQEQYISQTAEVSRKQQVRLDSRLKEKDTPM
ncbi:hypothetical protein BsWGS_15546 [Bradybaena similaris]